MTTLIALLITLAVAVCGIELANLVAYGWFATRRHAGHISLEVAEGQLSPFDFEIISTKNGFVSIVPLSVFSDYYYNADFGQPVRILRFTKLHREIQQKFQQLQNA